MERENIQWDTESVFKGKWFPRCGAELMGNYFYYFNIFSSQTFSSSFLNVNLIIFCDTYENKLNISGFVGHNKLFEYVMLGIFTIFSDIL